MPDIFHGERVLVVENKIIFKDGAWRGLKTDKLNHYLKLIRDNCKFIKRAEAEESRDFQQIIPFTIFKHRNQFFLYRYSKKIKERRLRGQYMLGIGGHINPADQNKNIDLLLAGAEREWQEEVGLRGKIISKKVLGILNDDRRRVEAVHLGIIYVFEGDRPDIFVRETSKIKGEMMTVKEMEPLMAKSDSFSWAATTYPYLKSLK